MSSLFSSTIQSQGTKGSPLIPANEFWHKQCVWQAVAGQHLWVQTSSIPRVNPSHVCNPHIRTALVLGVWFWCTLLFTGLEEKWLNAHLKLKNTQSNSGRVEDAPARSPSKRRWEINFSIKLFFRMLMYRWWTLRGMHLTISWTEMFSDNKRLNGGDFFRTLGGFVGRG